MSPLTDTDHERLVERLVRVLALLERPGCDGERSAAESAAGRLLAANPAYWRERLAQPTPSAALPETRRFHGWRAAVRFALEEGAGTAWELGFLARLPSFPRLSPKQAEILQRLVAKAGGEWRP